MRKVMVKTSNGEKKGAFHCWGNATEHCVVTDNLFPVVVAVVEMADGTVITCYPAELRFVDHEV